MTDWTQNGSTRSDVKVFILDALYAKLPRPPFTEPETMKLATRVYDYVWERNAGGQNLMAAKRMIARSTQRDARHPRRTGRISRRPRGA